MGNVHDIKVTKKDPKKHLKSSQLVFKMLQKYSSKSKTTERKY